VELDLPRWGHAELCDLVDAEIQHFAEVVQGEDMKRVVPTCPDWTLAKLIRHVGTVHRWAGTMVANKATERLDARTLDLGLPEHPSWLPGWLAAGGTELVERLRQADPDQPTWAWGTDQHARFWPRRMLHETVIHRVDAQLTIGAAEEVRIDPMVAEDGISELFTNLPSAAAFSPGVRDLKGTGSFALFAVDHGQQWIVRLHDDGFEVFHGVYTDRDEADAVITAPEVVLLLLLYRRLSLADADVEVQGDRSAFDTFLEHAALE
jgi:uncharacterized protein (TIGR03083 family)